MVSNSCKGFWSPSMAYCCWYLECVEIFLASCFKETNQCLAPSSSLADCVSAAFVRTAWHRGTLAASASEKVGKDSLSPSLSPSQGVVCGLVFVGAEFSHRTRYPCSQFPACFSHPPCVWKVLIQI